MLLWLKQATSDACNLSFFHSMPEDLRQFCLVDFMAEVRASTSHIQLSRAEKADLTGNLLGTVLKLVYAFVWQEEVLVDNVIFLNPFVNKVEILNNNLSNLIKQNQMSSLTLLKSKIRNHSAKIEVKMVLPLA